jgi:hypothetical protein
MADRGPGPTPISVTPCMPYTDLRAYDDGLRLSTCQYHYPLGTVIDRCLAAPRRPRPGRFVAYRDPQDRRAQP